MPYQKETGWANYTCFVPGEKNLQGCHVLRTNFPCGAGTGHDSDLTLDYGVLGLDGVVEAAKKKIVKNQPPSHPNGEPPREAETEFTILVGRVVFNTGQRVRRG